MSTDLVDALVDAFVGLTADEQRMIVVAYQLLSEGVPVEAATLAGAAGWEPEALDVRLDSWPGGAYLDDHRRLVGLWGMAVTEVSPHRARFAGGASAWMWCALDPLFILPLLGTAADVTSTSPATGARIRLRIEADRVSAVEPASTVVSFLQPDHPFDDDVRNRFCHFVHFFESPTAADTWTAGHPGTFWMSATDAAAVGRRLAARAFAAASRR